MSSTSLGRRYERLLFAAAPISFASLIVLFIAVASTTQDEHVKARCYEFAASTLEAKQNDLNVAWEASKPIRKEESWGVDYKHEISRAMIYSNIHAIEGCYLTIDSQINQRYRASPSDIIHKLKQDATDLTSTPMELYGVELPDKAAINILGTNIKIGLMTFTRVVQLVLAPILILWLGSLYNTRYRESILVGFSKHISDNFPHIINTYPAIRFPELRKRNWFLYHLPKIVLFLYACTRVALLMVFIAPPVIAYEWSLLLLYSDSYTALFIVIGMLVALFGLAPMALEFLPWHYHKIFPGPLLKL